MLSTDATESIKYTPPAQLPPQALMWQALKEVITDARALEMYFRITSEQILLVDKAPRHDTVLSTKDFELDLLFLSSMDDYYALSKAIWALKRSNENLEEAAVEAKGRLHGAVKVNVTDRLLRHIAEGQALLEVVRSQARDAKAPARPFEIRQKCTASLYRRTAELHEMISLIRSECKQYEFGDDSYSLLLQQETKLARIRAKLGKWRDNPSQKMAGKLKDAYAQVSAFNRAINELEGGLKAKCRLLGLRFYNRAGPC